MHENSLVRDHRLTRPRNPFGYHPWAEKRSLKAMFETLEADIVVFQEVKIQRKDLKDDMVLVPGWDVYFSLPRHKKGYSGVAIYASLSKCAPIRAEEGITGALCPPGSSTKFRDLPRDEQIGGYPQPGQLSDAVDDVTLDSEGRCVILEFPAFVLIGVYAPAVRDEARTEFRLSYIDAIDVRVRNLVAMGKQVVLCGDLNIIRSELDTAGAAGPAEPSRSGDAAAAAEDYQSVPGRRFLNQIVFGGRVSGERDRGREEPVLWDLCREFHPNRTGMYTCWDTRKNARPGNFGSRIDYVLCTSGIKEWFIDSNIQEGLLGSDHCPVYATMGEAVSQNGAQVQLFDVMNPVGMFKNGERQREWTNKDLLPTSARLMAEFDRRRSIRDMFFNMPIMKPWPSSYLSSPPTDPDALTFKPIPPPPYFPPKPQSTSASKRPAESAAASGRSQKKGKATEVSKPGGAGGQSTLKSFFKPATSVRGTTADTYFSDAAQDSSQASGSGTAQQSFGQGTSSSLVVGAEAGSSSWVNSMTEGEAFEKVHDPIATKEYWATILGKRVVPKCEHGEDCQSLIVKKQGVNCGTYHLFLLPLRIPANLVPQADRSTYALARRARREARRRTPSFAALHSSGAAIGAAADEKGVSSCLMKTGDDRFCLVSLRPASYRPWYLRGYINQVGVYGVLAD